MEVRKFIQLGNLSDDELFDEASKGLELIFKNATSISNDASFLATNKLKHGCEILQSLAEEEAAKFLMLLDVIRCDKRRNIDNFNKLLKGITSHLTRLIYAECCHYSPHSFGELTKCIDHLREEYYLDGPEGVEWIFRNRLIHERESNVYVDYIESDGKYSWQEPRPLGQKPLAVLDIITALNNAGCSTSDALRTIADIWRSVEIRDDFPIHDLEKINLETLNALKEKELLIDQPDRVYQTIIRGWFFPLYSHDLSLKKVKKTDLRKIQDEWSPYDY